MLIASAEVVKSSVCPSGALFATMSLAMLVVAPGRFSTTNGWPRYSESRGASTRAMMSVPPPGGKPTTTRTARLG
jgi:hypothetical protein